MDLELAQAFRVISRFGPEALRAVEFGQLLDLESIIILRDSLNDQIEKVTEYADKNGILEAIKASSKIRAVKEYRSLMKVGLREAKIAVETLEVNLACIKRFGMGVRSLAEPDVKELARALQETTYGSYLADQVALQRCKTALEKIEILELFFGPVRK